MKVHSSSTEAVLRRGPEGAMAPPEGGNNNLGGAQLLEGSEMINSINRY